MKNTISKFLLLLGDLLSIYISIYLAYFLRISLDCHIDFSVMGTLMDYTNNILMYAIVIIVLFNKKIYKNRYDFWEETYFVIKAIAISLVLVLSVLALSKSIQEYSRFVIVISFILMMFIIPIFKNILKKSLFKIGLWKRKAEIYGNNTYIKEEIFGNAYLGYVHSSKKNAQTIFIDTKNLSAQRFQNFLDAHLMQKKEVLFIPFLQSYNFANSQVIELTNARKNIIVLENALMKKSNIIIKKISDLTLSIILLPVFFMSSLIIIILMKKEEPKGKVFFKQRRMGQNGKEFTCYKFRSMYEDSEHLLEKYLKDNVDEVQNYKKFHKYKNDPRITKIGKFLRSSSLDELPQIFNVLKGEMSLIGPRPYMPSEKEKIGKSIDMILSVKPGITGLWQVSGRSNIDFDSRVEIDTWYTRNWNLWLDIVILIKTVKVVLFRKGAN